MKLLVNQRVDVSSTLFNFTVEVCGFLRRQKRERLLDFRTNG
jgi:hypothetical protein